MASTIISPKKLGFLWAFINLFIRFAITLLFPVLANAEGIIRDAEIEAVVKDLSQPIFKVAGLNPKNVTVYIYQSEEANAFVPEGKTIFISSKLLAFSDDPETLAGIIAHEVGHITSGHINARKSELQLMHKQALLTTIAGALAGAITKSPEVFAGAATGGQGIALMQFLKFSRSQENAADQAALKYLNTLGIHNEGILNFLDHMKNEEKVNSDGANSYLRTHPVTQERIRAIREFNNSSPTKSNDKFSTAFRDRFKRIVVKTRAFEQHPAETIKEYKDDQSLTGIYALAIAYMRLPQLDKALSLIDQLISKEPYNPYFYELKGQILLEMHKLKEAVSQFKKFHEFLPKNILAKYEYATLLNMAKSSPSHAISLLEDTVASEPDFIGAWHQLGIAYSLTKDNVNSNLALAREAVIKGDANGARRMLAIAEKEVMSSGNKRVVARYRDTKQALSESEENG